MFGVDLLYEPPSFANNSVMDKTMALFRARNTVFAICAKLKLHTLRLRTLGIRLPFFRIRTDLGMLAQRLLGAAHDEPAQSVRRSGRLLPALGRPLDILKPSVGSTSDRAQSYRQAPPTYSSMRTNCSGAMPAALQISIFGSSKKNGPLMSPWLDQVHFLSASAIVSAPAPQISAGSNRCQPIFSTAP